MSLLLAVCGAIAGHLFAKRLKQGLKQAEATARQDAACRDIDEAAPWTQEPPANGSPSANEDELRELDQGIALTGTALASSIAGQLFSPAFRLITIPCVLIPTVPLLGRAWADVRSKQKLTFAALELAGLVAALASGQFGLCALGFTIFQVGRRMLLMTRRKARDDLAHAFVEDQRIWVMRDGVEIETELSQLQQGEHVIIGAGQTIPCDGTIASGGLAIDESMFTGESMLAEKTPGDSVLGMTLAVSGRAVVTVTRSGAETIAARLSALVLRTVSQEQVIENKSMAIADATVLPALAGGGLSLVVNGIQGGVAGLWANYIDTLWLSAPISNIGLVRAAARHDILIRDARSLELLAEVDTVVFDKTGTLTKATLELVAVHPVAGYEGSDLLRLAACAEHRQRHPIALAITRAATAAGISPTQFDIGASTYEAGIGMRARVDGRDVLLGSERLLERSAVVLPATVEGLLAHAGARGGIVVCLAIDGRYAGAIELAPEIRPEAMAVVQALQRRGLELMVCTGDHEAPTRALAQSVGIDQWQARMLPEDKSKQVLALRAQGRRVCFVGDGINDALAMRNADVSISLTGAAALAIDSAQIVLRDGSLRWLDAVFEFGRHSEVANDRMLEVALVPSGIGLSGALFAGLGLVPIIGIYVVAQSMSMAIALASSTRTAQPTNPEEARAGEFDEPEHRASARQGLSTLAVIRRDSPGCVPSNEYGWGEQAGTSVSLHEGATRTS